MIDNNVENKSRFKNTIRALSHKNFRLFFSGQGISVIGTWIQRIAMIWLVYSLTNSAFILGVVGFAGQIPTLIVTPFAGVLADRMNKHKVILYTQVLSMFQAFILAVLVFTNTIQVWHIIVLSIILGIIDAVDMPTRQSFMVEMVGNNKDDLSNAIAMNSSMVNGARLIGPAIAGILISLVGEAWCFLINGLSFLAVIYSLIKMDLIPRVPEKKERRIFFELKEGFTYAFNFTPIKALLLMLALMSLMGAPIRVLAPVFAKQILHGGADTFGFLMGASGLGALIGAVYLMARKTILGLGRLIGYASGAFSLGLIAFGLSHNFLISLFFMLITGLGLMIEMAASNTVLQTIVEDNKRGRVMSFYAMSFRGMMPLGSLLSGILASLIGAPLTMIIGGGACLIGVAIYFTKLPLIRKAIRPTYEKLGILPAMLQGVQTATRLTFEERD
jgi:MFS family permease